MKKFFLIAMTLILCVGVMAQQRIQLRSVDKAECERSDMRGLKASFSFSTIEAENVDTQRGQFSWLSMPNTVLGGNEGDPQIPVVNELIAVPFGANPHIEITSYSSTDYHLDDLGIQTLIPRQPSLRKDQRPEDVPFVYNANAYQTRGLRSAPTATVYVDGTMRGIQVGKMTIEPVSYDPVSNTLRVFNDIEVEVHFDDADLRATEEMLVKTYSPYFDIVYKQLFNGRAVMDVYSQHPDLYTTPVKMMVITTSTYANNTTFQNWVKWKKQKGIYTTVYTTATTGTSSSSIKSFIRNKYNTDAPTFVVVVGDTGDVTYSLSSNTTSKVTDLYYSSTTDSDLYPEMFYSRMPVSSSTELANLLNKIMTYEQYTMSDPSYLSKVLLIAGADNTWAPKVGRPTINYAANYYYNTAHGFTNVYKYVSNSYSGCYNYLSSGVGFANYTAHGSETGWSDPSFSVSNANSLTNTNKYFWAMGNCCLAANWGYSGTCLAEALLRAANKGAFGYIGSCPETYWYEDYYFGVGATNTFNQMPTQNQTQTGVYDAMFDDTGFNTLNSVPFIGNIAVAYAHAGSYQYSTSDKYYWEAYHCLGDGSVMPYHVNPTTNNVSHASTLPIGATSFIVNADAGSYVAITVNNEIIGVAQVPSSGTISVPITAQTATGTAHIVVTRNQRQPYMQDIQIAGGTQYNIGASANPSAGGTVSGAGQYYESTECTLTATANEGYTFVNWTKNGAQVSTEPVYTFTVTANGNYVANFQLNSYSVTATANPTAGGTITGASTYNHGETCTMTAMANEGYSFTNWTNNGEVVSTDATYVFTVTGETALVANFSLNSYEVMATTNIAEGGIVAFGGDYNNALFYDFEDGTSQGWTIFQGSNGDSPDSWMHCTVYTTDDFTTGYGHNGSNGFMLSESLIDNGTAVHPDNYLVSPQVLLGGSVSFWATNLDDGFGAEHFEVAVSTGGNAVAGDFTSVEEWTLPVTRTGVTRTLDDGAWYEYTADLGSFSGMGYVAIHHFDCYDQWLLCVDDITVVEGYAGFVTDSFSHGETCTLVATANTGYAFIGWTEGGEEVSTEATYSFEVTGDRELVANFEEEEVLVEQSVILSEGMNWWSTNLDITLDDLKSAIEAALEATGGEAMIKSNTGFIKYQGGRWRPISMSFDIRRMYQIQVSTGCTITLTGVPVDPAEHPITVRSGANWIGYLSSGSMTVESAFSGLHPVSGDVVKSSTGSTTFTGTYWRGSFDTLEPGKGYIYHSKATEDKTFIFGTNNSK
jgi:uncharacterized repeat protein (TIGR02543 family)